MKRRKYSFKFVFLVIIFVFTVAYAILNTNLQINGTTYNSSHIGNDYAVIDTTLTPGYLTYKAH